MTEAPSHQSGTGTPKRSSTVGPISMMLIRSTGSRRLLKKIPGTSGGFMQWSPLQLFVLSRTTASPIVPVAQPHEAR